MAESQDDNPFLDQCWKAALIILVRLANLRSNIISFMDMLSARNRSVCRKSKFLSQAGFCSNGCETPGFSQAFFCKFAITPPQHVESRPQIEISPLDRSPIWGPTRILWHCLSYYILTSMFLRHGVCVKAPSIGHQKIQLQFLTEENRLISPVQLRSTWLGVSNGCGLGGFWKCALILKLSITISKRMRSFLTSFTRTLCSRKSSTQSSPCWSTWVLVDASSCLPCGTTFVKKSMSYVRRFTARCFGTHELPCEHWRRTECPIGKASHSKGKTDGTIISTRISKIFWIHWRATITLRRQQFGSAHIEELGHLESGRLPSGKWELFHASDLPEYLAKQQFEDL